MKLQARQYPSKWSGLDHVTNHYNRELSGESGGGRPGCWWGDYVALPLCVQVWQRYENTVADRQRLYLVSQCCAEWTSWLSSKALPQGLVGLLREQGGIISRPSMWLLLTRQLQQLWFPLMLTRGPCLQLPLYVFIFLKPCIVSVLRQTYSISPRSMLMLLCTTVHWNASLAIFRVKSASGTIRKARGESLARLRTEVHYHITHCKHSPR